MNPFGHDEEGRRSGTAPSREVNESLTTATSDLLTILFRIAEGAQLPPEAATLVRGLEGTHQRNPRALAERVKAFGALLRSGRQSAAQDELDHLREICRELFALEEKPETECTREELEARDVRLEQVVDTLRTVTKAYETVRRLRAGGS